MGLNMAQGPYPAECGQFCEEARSIKQTKQAELTKEKNLKDQPVPPEKNRTGHTSRVGKRIYWACLSDIKM